MLLEFLSKEELSQMSADELYAYILELEATPVPEHEFQAGTYLSAYPQYSQSMTDVEAIKEITILLLQTEDYFERMAETFDTEVDEVQGYPIEAWLADLKYLYERAITLNELNKLIAIKPKVYKMISKEYSDALALESLVNKVV